MYRSVTVNQSHGFWVSLKRTIFVTSLYFRLVGSSDPDLELLEEFNRSFYLVTDPRSLSFPAMVCKVLWRDATIGKVVACCTEGRFDRANDFVVSRVPRFLRYLDRETMARDAETVLRKSAREMRFS